jgi:hypothetical protein
MEASRGRVKPGTSHPLDFWKIQNKNSTKYSVPNIKEIWGKYILLS